MIGNTSPDVVIAGIAHATNAQMSPKIKAAVERVFEAEHRHAAVRERIWCEDDLR